MVPSRWRNSPQGGPFSLAGDIFGALGSRRAQDARRRRLLNAGYTEDDITRVRGPLGLDIGAVTPADTAVSILAEVLAVRAGREGGPLSGKTSGRIHPESVAT